MLNVRVSALCIIFLLASGTCDLSALGKTEKDEASKSSSTPIPKLSDVPADKVAYIQKLFDATGVEQNVSTNIEGICMVLSANLRRSLYDQLHKENSDTEACNKQAQEQTDKIMETFKKRLDIHSELFTIMASIYDKYFSESELKAMWAFYESPAGKKFTTKLPEMSKESQSALLERVRGRISAALLKEQMHKQHPETGTSDSKGEAEKTVGDSDSDKTSADSKGDGTKTAESTTADSKSDDTTGEDKSTKESVIEQHKHALIKRCLVSSGLKDGLRSFVTKQLDGVLEVARKSINASTFAETEKAKRLERIDALQTVFEKDVDMTEAICEITEELLDKHFSEKELEATVHYYESPIGKKAVALMPKITEESRDLGRVLLGPKIDEALNQSIRDVTDKKILNDTSSSSNRSASPVDDDKPKSDDKSAPDSKSGDTEPAPPGT